MTRLLIVDDDPELLGILDRFLREEGYDVIRASGGIEAIDSVKKGKPGIVLLDVMMPDMSGWEVCRKIKGEIDNKIKVCMTSVTRDPKELKKNMKESQADMHLRKPSGLKEILKTLKRLEKKS